MVRKYTEADDRAKYPEAYEAAGKYTEWKQKKARPLLDELPAPTTFYESCMLEYVKGLAQQMDELGLIVEELWKHRVEGKPLDDKHVPEPTIVYADGTRKRWEGKPKQ